MSFYTPHHAGLTMLFRSAKIMIFPEFAKTQENKAFCKRLKQGLKKKVSSRKKLSKILLHPPSKILKRPSVPL